MDERLAQLQDIQLPVLPGLWPPAPGWWLLAGLLLAALASVSLYLRWRYAPRMGARSELERLASAWRDGGDDVMLAAGLSALLRRVALLHHPRAQVAGLTGTAWTGFLAGQSAGGLSGQVFEPLADAAYRPVAELDGEALLAAARRWIEAQPW